MEGLETERMNLFTAVNGVLMHSHVDKLKRVMQPFMMCLDAMRVALKTDDTAVVFGGIYCHASM